jgi:hypothetical protein
LSNKEVEKEVEEGGKEVEKEVEEGGKEVEKEVEEGGKEDELFCFGIDLFFADFFE